VGFDIPLLFFSSTKIDREAVAISGHYVGNYVTAEWDDLRMIIVSKIVYVDCIGSWIYKTSAIF